MLDAYEVKRALESRALEVCQFLFPMGKKNGATFRIGDLDGAAGESLSIGISGPRAGLWKDHSTGERGDIIGLWKAARNASYEDALKQAAGEFSIPLHIDSTNRPERKFTEPKKNYIDLEEGGRVFTYLTEERGLAAESLKKYRVRQDKKDTMAVLLHYDDLQCCMAKGWPVPEFRKSPKVKTFSSSNPKHCLFGKPAANLDLCGGEIVITEGQWDCIVYEMMGYCAVSIPSGVDNEQWIENDWDWLKQFHTIYLSFDMDDPGREACVSAATRLGRERCKIVLLPLKDANDMLIEGRGDEIVEAVDASATLDPDDLVSAALFREQVKKVVQEDPDEAGWPVIFDGFPVRLRPHEQTLWTGYLGQGKSTVLKHVAMRVAYDYGVSTCIADLETNADRSLATMIKQWTCDGDIGFKEHYDEAYTSLSERIIIYDMVERVCPERIIDAFTYAHRRWGVLNFILDNVMMLKVNRQDNEAQAEAAYLFKDFVRKYPVHLNLVAHPRKPLAGEAPKPPNPHEVRGASEWGDATQNCIAVWRNLAKNDLYYQAQEEGATMYDLQELDKMHPDGKLVVGKQRTTGKLPQTPYWFNSETQLFRRYWDEDDPVYWKLDEQQ